MNSIKSQCNCPKFYRLISKRYLNTFAVRPDLLEKALKENDRTPDGPFNIDNYLREGTYPDWIQFPVHFHQIDGKKLRDVLESRSTQFDIISERMRSLLESHDISGWKSYPVRIFDRKENEITGFCGFSIVGRGGCIQYLRDGWEINFNYKKEDRVFDISQWDGSDIFLVYGGGVFITERVMKLLKNNKIAAVVYLPIEDAYTIVDGSHNLHY